MRKEEFTTTLTQACQQDTSSDPNNWTSENPMYGQCAVVAAAAQKRLGGRLLRASLEGSAFAHMRSHYINELPDGEREDFTASQFGDTYPDGLEFSPRSRSYVLSSPDTARRYNILSQRITNERRKQRNRKKQ